MNTNRIVTKSLLFSPGHATRMLGMLAILLGCCGASAQSQSSPAGGETAAAPAESAPADVGWPRAFELDGKRLTVHQPQVDSWKDFKELTFRCAIAVEGVLAEERYGVAEIHAETLVDHASRMVAITPKSRTIRFASATDPDAAALSSAVNAILPPAHVTIIALDRLLAYVDDSTRQVQRTTAVSLDPPDIFYSDEPAIIVIFIGKPKFKPVNPNKPGLQFAINTNWDVLHDTNSRQYYVLDGDGWITSSDPMKGVWAPAASLPFTTETFPDNENWAETRKHVPSITLASAPKVFVTDKPAELIVTDGPPAFEPIPNTTLSRVSNTESVLFRNTSENKYYFLTAGRWFRADQLSGPWTAASATLPPDFASIPADDPSEFVKASVPGTQEAKDAVLLASVPNTTTVNLNETTVQVVYNGDPKFVTIDGSPVRYAVNTPNSVFLADGKYYCCDQGVWFTSAAPTGPWTFSTVVPQSIYQIPPTNPHYNVTYVTVESSTPTTVTYAQTSGYSGEYVAATGVLMFGAGLLLGAAIADDDDYYYYPPYPAYYSYGCGARYHYGYGGYYAAAYASYGPYGGAGRAAAYNPATGTYARGAYAYGPYGSASAVAAYNPYTGARAAGGQVNTAYGSAGRAAAYNPTTGNYARAGYSSGQYGSAGFAQIGNANTGRSGTVAGATNQQGGSAAAWSTQNNQGKAVKTSSGDIYASNDGNVYKRDSDGNWSSNSGSGWQQVPTPEPRSTQTNQTTQRQPTSTGTSTQKPRTTSGGTTAQPQQRQAPASDAAPRESRSLDAQSQARQRGNTQTTRTREFQSSQRSRPSAGGNRAGGGGRGRR